MVETAASKPILAIHPLGMDERSQQTLRMFFERQLGGSCALSDERNAHAVLLDLDAHEGKGRFEIQLRDHPDRPLILLSLHDSWVLPANAVLVRKPINIGLLADALRSLSVRLFEQRRETNFSVAAEQILRSHLAHRHGDGTPTPQLDDGDAAALYLRSDKSFAHLGAAPDLDLGVPEQRAQAYYDPQNYLQGHVQAALALSRQRQAMVRLTSAAFRQLDVYGAAGKVQVAIAASTLYAASRLPLHAGDVKVEVFADAGDGPPAGGHVETAEALLWRLALWGSKGRVPVDTNLDWPVFIRRWPNLTRLMAPPHATRIAALWARQAFTLAATGSALGVPQRLVFAFYSACLAIGVAAPTRRVADTLVPPEPPKASEKRGLFRQLLGRLMRDWTDPTDERP